VPAFPVGSSLHERSIAGTPGAGAERWTAEVYVPARPLAGIVVFLHGQGDSGAAFAAHLEVRRHADERGFVAISPTARGQRWRGPFEEDAQFVSSLVEDVREELKIPAGRTYAVGFSAGAMLCFRLACTHTDQFDGLAPWGAAWPPVDRATGATPEWAQRGALARPIAFWNGVGAKDHLLPDVVANLQGWRSFSQEKLGCRGTESDFPGAEGVNYFEFSEPVRTRYCAVEFADHEWPAPSSGIDLMKDILDYFGL